MAVHSQRADIAGPATRHILCPASELPPGATRPFELPGPGVPMPIFLVHAGGGVRAYLNRCPHTGVTLDWRPGDFLDAERKFIQCSTHGALFRPDDGYCVFGPCAGDRLTPIEIRDVDGQLEAIVAPAPPVAPIGASR